MKSTKPITFRRVTLSDTQKLAEIVEDSYRDGDAYFIDYGRIVEDNAGPKQYTRTSATEIEGMVNDRNGQFYCAEIETGKLVGCGFIKGLNGQGVEVVGPRAPPS